MPIAKQRKRSAAPPRKAVAAALGSRTWRAEAEKQRRWAWVKACLAANMMNGVQGVRRWRLGWAEGVLAEVWDWESCGGFANLGRQCFFGWPEPRLTDASLRPAPPTRIATFRHQHHAGTPVKSEIKLCSA